MFDEQESDKADSDLDGEISISSRPCCANKHISYILGAPASDEEEDIFTPHATADDWNDGFACKWSQSGSDEETQNLEVELMNSFYLLDHYNPQIYTNIPTGALQEDSSQSFGNREHVATDNESWCNSDAESATKSEDECSEEEEENHKLWNSFIKSDDPYNPLCFKASVYTSERNNRDSTCKYAVLVCGTPSYCKLSLPPYVEDIPWFRDSCSPSVKCANLQRKKVTFLEEVTEYYMCDEEDRKGPWEECARDRFRFQQRIQKIEAAIGHCFTSNHRQWIKDCMVNQ